MQILTHLIFLLNLLKTLIVLSVFMCQAHNAPILS